MVNLVTGYDNGISSFELQQADQRDDLRPFSLHALVCALEEALLLSLAVSTRPFSQ
jgi:hypothetical protein